MFFDDEDRAHYLHLLERYCGEEGLRVVAYCLMTNHIHLVGIPERAESLGRAMKKTQQEHTFYINEKYARCGHLWHGRYFSCPMDLDHSVCAMGYVELNPVRAGMVRFPWEYAWSSCRAHCGEWSGDTLLDLKRWFGHYTAAEWRNSLLVEMENKGFLEQIRRYTRRGTPLGKHEFFRRRLEGG
ncbi:MAG: transposase [Candidatus Hydrogenedentes bacterium]|nr:transposase [Candidatus Hydrogenedentota bacterium]